jgi:hypothetical protein
MNKEQFIKDNLNKKEYVDLFPQVVGRKNYLGALYDIQEKAKKKSKKVEVVEVAEQESESDEQGRTNAYQTSEEE